MFKVNSRNSRKSCEIFTKLTIKTPERRINPFKHDVKQAITQCNGLFENKMKTEISFSVTLATLATVFLDWLDQKNTEK